MGSLEEMFCDNEHYKFHYQSEIEATKSTWECFRKNKEVLGNSIKVNRNGCNFNEPLVCREILCDYENVDNEIYYKLINTIYSNKEIARRNVTIDAILFSTPAFLIMTLWNPNLKLTDEQKNFAVSEALEKHIMGYCRGNFGLKYLILKSSNWSDEEKKDLILKFYPKQDDFFDASSDWKIGVAEDYLNKKNGLVKNIDAGMLDEYSYEFFLEFCKSKKDADEIWAEIEFVKSIDIISYEAYSKQENDKRLGFSKLNKK